jgi:siderophore synthetase component
MPQSMSQSMSQHTDTPRNTPPRTPRDTPPGMTPGTPASVGAAAAASAVAGLAWRSANRALLAKVIGEFCYEELLEPRRLAGGDYRIDLGPELGYTFRADRGSYGAWFVDPESPTRVSGTVSCGADDALGFVADAADALGLPGDTAGHLVRELAATLAADVRLNRTALPAAELADLDYAQLEGHQVGHPWIVFNKGRLGFSASDAARYAPEARQAAPLPWIAVRDDLASYHSVPDLPTRRLYTEELSVAERVRFGAELVRHGFSPARYLWLPVHPWQWDEQIQPLFAAEIAGGAVVPLGTGDDSYLPQQSIRTVSNISNPTRRHVKLPLSVLNTMVWRGLPTDRTIAAPAVTTWLTGIAAADPFLAEQARVTLLGEVASVAVRHPVLDRMAGIPYQYRELLGVIWRDALPAALAPGERARTLAALLHVDPAGRPFVAELVARSPLTGERWLGRLFDALLPPLLHFLYKYGTVFSPHGENAVVVYDADDVPVRLAVKDFVDDVNLSAKDLPELAGLPEAVAGVLLREPPDYLCQFLHGALFVGHFRYLARIAERHLDVPAERFWAMVRETIERYQRQFPELASRFALFDLATPTIDRLCLNRARLLMDGYRDRPTRPHVGAHGKVANPLAAPAP